MTMTFDEAIEQVDYLTQGKTTGLSPDVAIMILNSLRDNYAPAIEMPQRKKDEIVSLKEEDYTLLLSLLDGDGYYDPYWIPLTDEQVAQAWLHMDTIKIVDED